jgi:hypothetical protein
MCVYGLYKPTEDHPYYSINTEESLAIPLWA